MVEVPRTQQILTVRVFLPPSIFSKPVTKFAFHPETSSGTKERNPPGTRYLAIATHLHQSGAEYRLPVGNNVFLPESSAHGDYASKTRNLHPLGQLCKSPRELLHSAQSSSPASRPPVATLDCMDISAACTKFLHKMLAIRRGLSDAVLPADLTDPHLESLDNCPRNVVCLDKPEYVARLHGKISTH